MTLVDNERVLLELEKLIQSKPHHGSRDLAMAIVELRARHTIDESLPEEMLRLYGVQLSDDLRASARDKLPDSAGGSPADVAAAAPDGRSIQTTEEVSSGSRNEGTPAGIR